MLLAKENIDEEMFENTSYHYRWKMGHNRRSRLHKYLQSRILLDRDETHKNRREKIWEESTRSIGNSASTDVTA